MVPKLRFNETKNTTYSTVTLGEAVQSISSGRSKDCVENGNFKFYGSTGIIGFRSTADYEGTAILIARVGANAGSLYMVNGKYNVSDNTLIVSADTQFINYLYFYLSAINLNKLVYGSGQPLITGGMLKSLKIEIPGTKEQTKIADFLSSVDEKITLLNKQYDLLCQYKKSMMQKIFSQEVRFKDERGEEFPKWETCELKNFLIPTLREVKKPSENFLSVGIRSHFKGTFHKNDQDPNKVSVDKLFLVHEGDFILNITFAWEGALAIARKEDHLGYVSHRFPTYTFKKEFMAPTFFRYIYTLPKFLTYLDLCSPGGAGRNRVLKKSEFIEIEIDKPCMAEQIKIANFLSALDDKIAVKKAELDKLKTWKQGLLQQMFV
ncbi:restriction endonuclease subunit S [Enterobacter cloacae]|uniref:restriction endonuclease subunit S n=1 Tax=Enterobacter cloacae TaxID=550 RepID=UPI0034CEE80E